MASIDSIVLVVTPKQDVAWGVIAKECIELSVKEWRNVEFDYNGATFRVQPNDLIGSVKEMK